MLGYPLKFLMATFMLCTVFNYVELKMPKWLIFLFGIIFITDYFIAITNAQTLWMLQLEINDVANFESLYTAEKGIMFFYHLAITYLVLFISIAFLGIYLKKKSHIRQYKVISRTMFVSVIIVLLFNVLQLLTEESNVDLTYVSLVIATFALYQVIYSKDMVFNLKMSGRGEILSNMREMYVLTDAEDNIVDVSKLLEEKYDLSVNKYIGNKFSQLLEDLRKQIIVYEEYNVDEEGNEDKDHLHLRRKEFTLKTMKGHGVMYLLYDETQVFILLRELNKLSNYDNMTGLHNRNFIENRLKNISVNNSLGIISLDLNGLKANNDYIGHERGDYLLKKLAVIMKEVMLTQKQYEMARIGGDEFVIILENTSLKTLDEIKDQILSRCYSENLYETVSVSIGTAFNDVGNDVFALLQEADQNMYKMKKETSQKYSMEIVKYATNKDNYIR
jgi:diguanylate cyclase (GGDEF)-like protein